MSKGKKGRKFKPNTKPKLVGIQYWGPPALAMFLGAVSVLSDTSPEIGISDDSPGIEQSDNSSDKEHSDNSSNLIIATTKDLEDDKYEGQAPVYNNGEVEYLLDEGTMVLVDESVKSDENMYYAIDHGIMKGDYLNFGQRISKKDLEQYNIIYEVVSTVNVRKNDELNDDNIIRTIPEGIRVLGGNKNNDENMWTKVMFIDSNGETTTGYISGKYLKELDEITILYQKSGAREMMVNTSSKTLNLRSSPSSKDDSNIIYKLPNGKIVKTTGRADEISETTKWTEITYTDDEDQEHIGWAMSEYLEDEEMILKKVVTGQKGMKLNVRKAPGLDTEVIATIENSTNINVSNFDIANMENVDGIDWVRVNLKEKKYGYVASQYLVDAPKDIENSGLLTDEEIQEKLDKKRINKDGMVVGIDVSGMPAEKLEKVINNPNAIPEYMTNITKINGKKIKTTYYSGDLAGSMDYVIVKMGARGTGEKGYFANNGTYYIDTAKMLEEKGFWHGSYFYSTARTKAEAKEEVDYCKKMYDDLCKELGRQPKYDFNYFMDYEGNDRVNGADHTEVIAYWLKYASELFGRKWGFYSGGKNVVFGGEEQLVDLEKLIDELGWTPDCWFAMHRLPNNPYYSYGQNQIINLEKHGFYQKEYMTQTLLDVYGSEIGLCDVDIIDATEFDKMIWESNAQKREKQKPGAGIKYVISQEEIENQAETTLMIDDAINWVKEHFGGENGDDGER